MLFFTSCVASYLRREYGTSTNDRAKTNAAQAGFTGTQGVEKIYHILKPADSGVLTELIKKTNFHRTFSDNKKTPRILDVGGAKGEMLEQIVNDLEMKAQVFINEPNNNQARIERYRKRINENERMMFFGQSRRPIESRSCQVPEVDMVLASHVLYYNQDDWFRHQDLNSHLFTKLLLSLAKDGIMTFVIQSIANNDTSCHESLEDFVYPLIEKKAHSFNHNYANAEMVDLALNFYEKLIMQALGEKPAWTIHRDTAECIVPFEEINFDICTEGKYQQSDECLEKFQFYLKGKSFLALETKEQEKFLNFVKENLNTSQGYGVKHVNVVYAIEPTHQFLKQLKAYCDKYTKSALATDFRSCRII